LSPILRVEKPINGIKFFNSVTSADRDPENKLPVRSSSRTWSPFGPLEARQNCMVGEGSTFSPTLHVDSGKRFLNDVLTLTTHLSGAATLGRHGIAKWGWDVKRKFGDAAKHT
jgi:hypothetical protein